MNYSLDWIVSNWSQINAVSQAFFCGGIAFFIAFKYQRNGSSYRFIPSLCAFGIASLLAQQWLYVLGGILIHNKWPDVSIYETLIFAFMFALIVRSKGNVSRMFQCKEKSEAK